MTLQALKLLPLALSSVLIVGCAGDSVQEVEVGYDEDGGAGPMAMAHVDHVMSQWMDTPDRQGLLTTARAEAAVMRTHAELALQRADDSDWVKMHAVHVRHTLIPEGVGPGQGYGLVKAVEGVRKHIGLAMEQDDVSDAVEFHGEQIAMSTETVLMRADQLLMVVDQVLSAPRTQSLAHQAQQMSDLADQILMGQDLNQDGEVSWEDHEPGLNQTLKYANFLRQKESMSAN